MKITVWQINQGLSSTPLILRLLIDEKEFELVIDVRQAEQELPVLLQKFNVPAPAFVYAD